MVVSLLPTTAKANDALSACYDQVDACEDLLKKGDLAINSQAATIDALQAQDDRLQRSLESYKNQLTESERRADAWYRQPEYVAPIALIVGITVGARVSK
jgi:chromosome segregation ATPase